MKFKELKKKIIEMLELITADCGNCLHRDMCPFREDGNSGTGNSCWERGKGSYYIRNKNK